MVMFFIFALLLQDNSPLSSLAQRPQSGQPQEEINAFQNPIA